MGRVFVARDRHKPNRLVVIKVMHPNIANQPRFRALFQREMEFMSRFHHPYAVQLLESSLDSAGGPCIIMEYLPGQTLEVVLGRNKRLGVERTGVMLAQLCHALQAAHRQGIVHRDLKPSNLMILESDTPVESLRVMDFGLSQFSAKPHLSLEKLNGSSDIRVIGTPDYVSPEAVRGDEIDARADIYALGVILYEMLTGMMPYDAIGTQAQLEAHRSAKPIPFNRIRAVLNIPHAVEALIMQCLEKFPAERPSTPREIAKRYGEAIGLDVWSMTRPPEDPSTDSVLMPAVPHTPTKTRSLAVPAKLTDPYVITFDFDAWMPEKIAITKLRGFLSDVGGEVLASDPGLIKVRLHNPSVAPPPLTGILGWLSRMSPPPPPIGPREIAELELQLDKPELNTNRLRVQVTCKPMDGTRPADLHSWQQRCAKIQNDLRAYLMG
ncbi:serine threonine protein kinase : Uncharacterized protein OS=Sorangium cellulosum So0157-2 GN=SCE1572_03000 PE=3 SV=1: Pkinase [Tuwongella immobilis]|uniref:Protein kinase domain-containing protein n=2 Tax=Tuwongella immobilis TaxID=692036 RepID=A0A6C2YS62_9BACT|nr:serine threonine protein kinase : Uncharacterized protein OS=Sorangium cellulosum So0157-2 GN=SCE1572_03000 PE=3 SV=1: Pkinase [Tuwongella immobilis]VTS05738.1 serine threonine protein kinase : Uncharacterized protein OS=Sorangium cellulosum So0157-2 GN=SCE1572_03000 PE=3 SV=1: Pkinase [Tuwongella immobilis]